MACYLSLVELWKTDGRGPTVQSRKLPGNSDFIIYTIPFTKRAIATEDQNNTEVPFEQAKAKQMLVRGGGS